MGAAAPGPSSWRGRDLLGISGLSPDELRTLLHRAEAIREQWGSGDTDAILRGRIVATLFFEDSTRTKSSFTVAAKRLGADTIDLSASTSSVNKGETLADTARTVDAMGVDAIVVRAKQAGAAALVAAAARCPVINAGDGRHEHPTQALLDMFTIASAFGRAATFDLAGLRIAIVGDVANSRVARSAIAGLTLLGARVVCVGPPGLVPARVTALGCEVARDLDAVLPTVDVAMMLRIQFERSDAAPGAPARTGLIASVREYRTFYALTPERACAMRAGAIVMHPGPMNRGIEIDSEVADGPRSRVTAQVTSGVLCRAAILAEIIAGPA